MARNIVSAVREKERNIEERLEDIGFNRMGFAKIVKGKIKLPSDLKDLYLKTPYGPSVDIRLVDRSIMLGNPNDTGYVVYARGNSYDSREYIARIAESNSIFMSYNFFNIKKYPKQVYSV